MANKIQNEHETNKVCHKLIHLKSLSQTEGKLPYMGYIGMCRCEGYGFQAVYSRIGYINQSVWL